MSDAWTKTEVLGSGRATSVWRGRDERLGRPVAIKELHSALAARPGFAEAYLAEARRMAAVSHPRVLTVHGVDDSAETPRLIVELAEGTARDLLATGPLQPGQAERLLVHALEGLAAIHREGVVHRGVKPENLFCRGDGFKVGDFAMGHTPETPTLFLSSPRHTAPEQLAPGGEGAEARSDLYSLGLVLYELLLGTRRFDEAVGESLAGAAGAPSPGGGAAEAPGTDPGAGADRFDLWLRFHRDAPDLPPPAELDPGVPEGLSRVVARLARKDPGERPPDAEAALRELRETEGGAGPARAPENPTVLLAGRERGEGPRRGRRLVPLAGLALVLGAIAAFLLWPSGARRVAIRSTPSGAAVLTGEGDVVATTPVEDLLVSRGGELTLRKEGFLDRVVRFDDPARKLYEIALEGAGPPPEPTDSTEPGALTEALLDLTDPPGTGPELALDGDPGPELAFGTPLRFAVRSDRDGGMVLFTVSPDGTVHRLYPAPGRPVFPVRAGEELVLPLPEDRAAGFHLVTAAPAGREAVFLFTRDDPRPPPAPPEGERARRWVVPYPFDGPTSPAAELVRWIAGQRRERPDGTGLAGLVFRVVPTEEAR